MYIEPPEIWLDQRVLVAMKTEPDPDADLELVRYRSDQRVGDLVLAASGGAEFFIHIQLGAAGIMFALTNYGRIFRQTLGVGVWEVVEVPDFGEVPES